VRDEPGQAYALLADLSESGINLLAFSAIPLGPQSTQLMIFPQSEGPLAEAAERAGIDLTGPEHALLCRGDDELGAVADIHRRLYDAQINVYSSTGISCDCGHFAYMLCVKADKIEHAARVLGV
jgi:hypothetical protein